MMILWMVLACGGADNAPAPEAAPAVEAPAPEAEAAPAEAEAEATEGSTAADTLKKAGLADGTEDKVVSKCSGCMLGMDGDAAHAATHEDYTLHFCSDSCKSGFEADPAARIEALSQM